MNIHYEFSKEELSLFFQDGTEEEGKDKCAVPYGLSSLSGAFHISVSHEIRSHELLICRYKLVSEQSLLFSIMSYPERGYKHVQVCPHVYELNI